jgi:hypothetical protein
VARRGAAGILCKKQRGVALRGSARCGAVQRGAVQSCLNQSHHVKNVFSRTPYIRSTVVNVLLWSDINLSTRASCKYEFILT